MVKNTDSTVQTASVSIPASHLPAVDAGQVTWLWSFSLITEPA